jgi:hypothetical protein
VRRYDELWRRYVAPPVPFVPPTTLASTTPAALHALGLLGVADLIQQPIDPPVHAPALRLVYAGRDARLYANRDALPRTFLVDRQDVVAGDGAALRAIGDLRLPLRRVAVTEQRLPGLTGGGAAPSGSPGSARLTTYAPERLTIAATATRPSLLVLSDLSYPGWSATVDGRMVALRRVDYLLRGVLLGPGRHRVTMRYSPASWRAGRWISLLAALVILLTLVAGGRIARGTRRRSARR